jgi:hypothetical protein
MYSDGGPAFPLAGGQTGAGRNREDAQFQYGQHGMSLRDYYAGQIMASLLSHDHYSILKGIGELPQGLTNDVWTLAQQMVDTRDQHR